MALVITSGRHAGRYTVHQVAQAGLLGNHDLDFNRVITEYEDANGGRYLYTPLDDEVLVYDTQTDEWIDDDVTDFYVEAMAPNVVPIETLMALKRVLASYDRDAFRVFRPIMRDLQELVDSCIVEGSVPEHQILAAVPRLPSSPDVVYLVYRFLVGSDDF